jgi:hypothetical protein
MSNESIRSKTAATLQGKLHSLPVRILVMQLMSLIVMPGGRELVDEPIGKLADARFKFPVLNSG